jgi:peptidoglycan/xylan/chitin deacetylase (PgdA/CDA1 family)
MLLSLFYHRIGKGKWANSPEMIEAHLTQIAASYRTVFPLEPLSFFEVALCLVFDDAYFDVYHYVFPLLKKLGLKAVIAVPTSLIQERTALSAETRLSVPTKEAMSTPQLCPFCTWEELNEMVKSGHVQIASHSHTHCPLSSDGIDLDLEIWGSKAKIEQKLGVEVNAFVYPLGKFSRGLQKKVSQCYPLAMRIGTAWNLGWGSGLIYRVLADHLEAADEPFRWSRWLRYSWFYALNRSRGR